MGKKVKSARGEFIDFDLLKIKEQIAAAPPPVDVQQRRDFVERRLRRRTKKKLTVESAGEVKVEPKMPAPAESPVDEKKEARVEQSTKDVKTEESKSAAPKPKQRARRKKQPNE